MNWALFNTEIFYFCAAVVFLVLAMLRQTGHRTSYHTALFLAALGVVVCIGTLHLDGLLFLESYRIDLFSQVCKALLAMGLLLVVCLCSELEGVAAEWHNEFYMLLFTCTLAMMLLVSSVHMITIYVSLELSSYTLYVMVALRRDKVTGTKAALKYFLVGVVASAVMLFGLALLYAACGATYLTDLVRLLPPLLNRPLVMTALLLTLCGFFFKLAVFPFHFWAPDVYAGAPNQLAAYIATASKVAAIAILMRVTAVAGDATGFLVDSLVVVAIVSMTVGNLVALVQKDLKRLLAYSSIAHAGYVLIGILSLTPAGYSGALFYALALVVMKFTCFLVVIKVADDGRNIDLDQLAGLHRRAPLLAMALMLAVFGLAGIPPTVGFTAKLLVFNAAMQNGYLTLILIAMFNVVISLYYYLLIVKAAYLTEPAAEPAPMPVSGPVKGLVFALVGTMLVTGIAPHYLIELARRATRVLF